MIENAEGLSKDLASDELKFPAQTSSAAVRCSGAGRADPLHVAASQYLGPRLALGETESRAVASPSASAVICFVRSQRPIRLAAAAA